MIILLITCRLTVNGFLTDSKSTSSWNISSQLFCLMRQIFQHVHKNFIQFYIHISYIILSICVLYIICTACCKSPSTLEYPGFYNHEDVEVIHIWTHALGLKLTTRRVLAGLRLCRAGLNMMILDRGLAI